MIDARNRLEILNRQREAIEKSPAQSVQIESFTTPLGRTVDGREVHFQLSHGRIAYVPLNELVEKAVADLKRKAHKLSEQRPELTDTVPPEQGFRLTYTIRLRPPTMDEIRESGSQRPKIEDRFVLTPVADNLGETIDEAFRARLAVPAGPRGPAGEGRHGHALDLSRQFRRLPPREEGALSTRLSRCGPAFAGRRADQRIFQRQQVDGRVRQKWQVSEVLNKPAEFAGDSPRR